MAGFLAPIRFSEKVVLRWWKRLCILVLVQYLYPLLAERLVVALDGSSEGKLGVSKVGND